MHEVLYSMISSVAIDLECGT
uniref:Uncharacterized protein n=1 Tax=Arundo donax TaxID=35708 RepID=A0A0A8ZBJ8_ARUDO